MSPGGQINSDLRATDVESCIDFKNCWLYNYFERKQMKRKSHIKWNSREGQRWLQWGSKGNTRVKMVPNTASFLGSRNSCGNNLYPRERQRDQSCRGTLPPQHSRVRVYSSCHLLVIHEHCIGVGGDLKETWRTELVLQGHRHPEFHGLLCAIFFTVSLSMNSLFILSEHLFPLFFPLFDSRRMSNFSSFLIRQ